MSENKNIENMTPGFSESQENIPQSSPEIRDNVFESQREREITRENIQEAQKQTITKAPQKQTKKKLPKISISQQANSIKEMDDARKVETLSTIAFERGIKDSINIAMKLQDPFILDALHDRLIEEYEELVKRGKLKEI